MEQRTLFFSIATLGRGGAERVILQLARHFAAAGYRAIVVTNFVAEDEYPLPQGVERIVIENTKASKSTLKRNISRISALRRLCKKYRPQAIISFMREPNFRSLCATRGLRVKNIISVRSDPRVEYSGRFNRFIGRHFLPCADGCIFQTEDAKTWFPEKLQKKSIVIPNAVAPVFFEMPHVGKGNIVTLGRLDRAKNHMLLMAAFAQIAAEFPDCNLEIYGKGPLHEDMQTYIHTHAMEERIRLMGTTGDSAKALSDARLFVLSSNVEGMPNALMEALAVGVPSISTDCPCGGPRSLIRDAENGLLVPVGDVDAMANAMRRILSDPSFSQQLGENAKRDAAEFAPDKIFTRMREYIEGIIGESVCDNT